MTEQHPITPPTDLVDKWDKWYDSIHGDCTSWKQELATKAARWGADQELEACIQYFHEYDPSWGEDSELIAGLRAARRPSPPPSLQEQALAALRRQSTRSVPSLIATEDCDIIRRALERLQELEGQE